MAQVRPLPGPITSSPTIQTVGPPSAQGRCEGDSAWGSQHTRGRGRRRVTEARLSQQDPGREGLPPGPFTGAFILRAPP